MELMRFSSELIDVAEFKGPAEKSVGKAEMQMPEQLIESMTTEWEPEQYTDEYRDALENLIEEKIEHGDKAAPAAVQEEAALQRRGSCRRASREHSAEPGKGKSRQADEESPGNLEEGA